MTGLLTGLQGKNNVPPFASALAHVLRTAHFQSLRQPQLHFITCTEYLAKRLSYVNVLEACV